MTTLLSTDVDQARRYFDQTLNRVAEVTTELSNPQWKFKPAPDRWSIAEILEHMVMVQERVLGPILAQVAQAPAASAGRDCQEVDLIVLEKFPDRSHKAKAPVAVEPSGQLSPPAALDRLSRNYERLSDYIESCDGLRERVLEAPPLKFVTNGAFDTMDGYQWALAVAAHDRRHVQQILEVKADPHYPA
jgi:hypothetical protein